MYKIINETGDVYTRFIYDKEADFEKMIVEHSEEILGKSGIYFDIKKLIGIPKKGATIPDGYYLDLTFHNAPKLYLVEVELSTHDVYAHIGEQILRFGISSETDKFKIKKLLNVSISGDLNKQQILNNFFKESQYNNISELLDKVIFDNKPAAVIIIDEATEELNNVLSQLTMTTEIIEAQTYVCGDKKLHKFTPLNDEIYVDLPESDDADELDTVVVPAREDGFKEEFLSNNQWFAIRISASMIDKIKYIAAYQVAPISGITHIAEVQGIEKYKDTDKYIVYFKNGSIQKLNTIGLGNKKGNAPQAPRYTSYKRIFEAKTLDDIWK